MDLLAHDLLPGSGPLVVLLHAGVTDRRAWAHVAPALAEDGSAVLVPDRRGFGQTPPGPPDRTHVADLLDLLDRPAWLVGSSMGGALALDTALTAPDRVAGLVLLGAAVSGEPEGELEDLDDQTRALAEQLRASRDDPDRRLELLTHLWLDGPSAPGRVQGDVRERFQQMCRAVLETDQSDEAGASDLDAWSRLGEIAVPTTVAVGALDLADIRASAREIAGRVPGARLVELPGTAHLPSLDAPDAVVRLVQEARACAR